MANAAAPSQESALRDDPLNDINQVPPTTPLDSSMSAQYNSRNPAVKRLFREAVELSKNEDPHILHAQPLEDNLFEWHFTFRGPPDTVYGQGIYHGRVIFPSKYPMSPPEIVILTPNGRFETGTKICLSISNYHPETWLPSWGIRTAITALRSFMCTDTPGAIGSMECSEIVRKQMARTSQSYECPCCGPTIRLLQPLAATSQTEKDDKAVKTLEIEEIPKERGEAVATISTCIENELDKQSVGEAGDTLPEIEEEDTAPLVPNYLADTTLTDKKELKAEAEQMLIQGLLEEPESTGMTNSELTYAVLIALVLIGIFGLSFRRVFLHM